MSSSVPVYMQVVQQDVDEELELDQGGVRAPVRVGLTAALSGKRSFPGSIGPCLMAHMAHSAHVKPPRHWSQPPLVEAKTKKLPTIIG